MPKNDEFALKNVFNKHKKPSEVNNNPELNISEGERAKKRPGPKGRGLYCKKTIDLPPDLHAFVEEARRGHVRPNGQRSTAYSHFFEDVLAAERNRRANEVARRPVGASSAI